MDDITIGQWVLATDEDGIVRAAEVTALHDDGSVTVEVPFNSEHSTMRLERDMIARLPGIVFEIGQRVRVRCEDGIVRTGRITYLRGAYGRSEAMVDTDDAAYGTAIEPFEHLDLIDNHC